MGHGTAVFRWDGITRTRRTVLPETTNEHTKYRKQLRRHCTSGNEGQWPFPWNTGNKWGEAKSCRVASFLWELPGHGTEKGTQEESSSLPESRRQSWEPGRGLESTRWSTGKTATWRIWRGSHLGLQLSRCVHVEKPSEARERTTWKDWRPQCSASTQGWAECLLPPARLEALNIHGPLDIVTKGLTLVVGNN